MAITWVLEAQAPASNQTALRRLMVEMTEETLMREPGCLVYDWYLGPDGETCHIIESYEDEAALLTHVEGFNRRFAKRFFSLVKPRGLTVYGALSEAGQEALAPLNPVFFQPLKGPKA